MNKRSSAPARVIAVTTLVVAFIVAIVVIAGALGGGDSNGSGKHKHGSHATHGTEEAEREVPATYVVKSGDTLVAISHRFGVPLVRIQELNPEVDPQILIAGEKLKLREAP
jgi:LysM repeat protein